MVSCFVGVKVSGTEKVTSVALRVGEAVAVSGVARPGKVAVGVTGTIAVSGVGWGSVAVGVDGSWVDTAWALRPSGGGGVVIE